MWKRACRVGDKAPVSQSVWALASVEWPHRSTSLAGGESAGVKTICGRNQEGSLRQIHLQGDVLHPLLTGSAFQKTDPRRVSGKGHVRKRIDLIEGLTYDMPFKDILLELKLDWAWLAHL